MVRGQDRSSIVQIEHADLPGPQSRHRVKSMNSKAGPLGAGARGVLQGLRRASLRSLLSARFSNDLHRTREGPQHNQRLFIRGVRETWPAFSPLAKDIAEAMRIAASLLSTPELQTLQDTRRHPIPAGPVRVNCTRTSSEHPKTHVEALNHPFFKETHREKEMEIL